jgi:hypothetical protein
VERIVRGWRRVDRQAEAREVARQHAGRALHVHRDDDGTVVLRGRLSRDGRAAVARARRRSGDAVSAYRPAGTTAAPLATGLASAGDPALEPPTWAQQQADALALLAETALHHGLDPGSPGERYQVVVHVDAAGLADAEQAGQSTLEEMGHVSAETSRRLACDASRVVMRHTYATGPRAVPPRWRTSSSSAGGITAYGLRINARTAGPVWLGERQDVGWALDVLHPRTAPGAL